MNTHRKQNICTSAQETGRNIARAPDPPMCSFATSTRNEGRSGPASPRMPHPRSNFRPGTSSAINAGDFALRGGSIRIAQCDYLACRARIGPWKISILQSPSEVPEECEASDLVILSVRSAGPVARRNCDAVLIDESTLRETGALDVYLKDRLTTKPARPPKERRRAWD